MTKKEYKPSWCFLWTLFGIVFNGIGFGLIYFSFNEKHWIRFIFSLLYLFIINGFLIFNGNDLIHDRPRK